MPVPGGSKYARGLVLAIGGARATPGAVMLAGRAALRMGAGRLSLAVAESVCAHVAVAVPECGAYGLAEDSAGSITGRRAAEVLTKELSRADAVLIGPGLDDPAGAAALLTEVIPALPKKTPVLLDAFGATVLPVRCPMEIVHSLVQVPSASSFFRKPLMKAAPSEPLGSPMP